MQIIATILQNEAGEDSLGNAESDAESKNLDTGDLVSDEPPPLVYYPPGWRRGDDPPPSEDNSDSDDDGPPPLVSPTSSTFATTFAAIKAHDDGHDHDTTTTTTTENDEPRSRQAAGLNMSPDVEHAVMTMLKGDNPDWHDFKDRLSRSAAACHNGPSQ